MPARLHQEFSAMQFVYANTINAMDLCNVNCVSDSIDFNQIAEFNGVQRLLTSGRSQRGVGGGGTHSVLNFLSIIWSNYEISVHCNCIARRNCPVSFLSPCAPLSTASIGISRPTRK